MTSSPGNYYFYIINRFDSLIYESDFSRTSSLSNEKKKDDTPYFYQFMAHASLDFLDEKLAARSNNLYYPNIDRFNEWSITAFVTPSYLRFIILHDYKSDEALKSFFQEAHEIYIKHLLNPFYGHNEIIKSEAFDRKIKAAAKRHLGV